jgi:hypothetical protein
MDALWRVRTERLVRAALVALFLYGVLVFLGGRAERGVVCAWLAAVVAAARPERVFEGGGAALAVRMRVSLEAAQARAQAAAPAAAREERRRRPTVTVVAPPAEKAAGEAAPGRPAPKVELIVAPDEPSRAAVARAAYIAQNRLVSIAWAEAALAIGFGAPLGKAAIFTALFAVATGFVHRTGAVLHAGFAPPGWRPGIYVRHWLAFFVALVAAGRPEPGLAVLLGFHLLFCGPALVAGAIQSKVVQSLALTHLPERAPVWPFYVAGALALLNVVFGITS